MVVKWTTPHGFVRLTTATIGWLDVRCYVRYTVVLIYTDYAPTPRSFDEIGVHIDRLLSRIAPYSVNLTITSTNNTGLIPSYLSVLRKSPYGKPSPCKIPPTPRITIIIVAIMPRPSIQRLPSPSFGFSSLIHACQPSGPIEYMPLTSVSSLPASPALRHHSSCKLADTELSKLKECKLITFPLFSSSLVDSPSPMYLFYFL